MFVNCFLKARSEDKIDSDSKKLLLHGCILARPKGKIQTKYLGFHLIISQIVNGCLITCHD